MLKQCAMRMMPESIKPAGWLKRQLTLQAEGLAGNLDKIWPDVRDSKWIGGSEEGWERVPYWLDGFIPLAYQLEREDMQARAKRYVDAILERQEEDGWICPCTPEARDSYDVWAVFLITKVLAQYADYSGDPRIEEALYRCFAQLDRHIDVSTLKSWGAARWFEGLIGLAWLYERRPEPWMISLADKMRFQGFDYEQIFDRFGDCPPQRRWTMHTHVVNMAMCLKQEALYARFGSLTCGDFAERALKSLLQKHGQATMHFSGDECLAGTSPVQGTELCGVVEAMYSYEQLLSITGEPSWGDQLERLAFNALPATCSADMWTHQYDQQVNQIRCAELPQDHIVYGTNFADANRFGLEPNFGCCTANMGQGWPKLLASAFMRKDDGIAICALVPSILKTQVRDTSVSIEVKGDYPFRDELTICVTAQAPISFPLFVRIPGYVTRAELDGDSAQPGTFAKIEKTWSGETQIQMRLVPEQNMMVRPSGMSCLWRGGLLFALPIEESWVMREEPSADHPRIYPYCDYDILPTGAWAYAFAGEEGELEYSEMAEMPFDTKNPPVAIRMPMVPIDWREEHGVARPTPESTKPQGCVQWMRLIPYGSTQLRMTEMPVVVFQDI